MQKGHDIAERLLEFAAKILEVAGALRRGTTSAHVRRQMIRCGTSAGANYAEACAAQSRSDFAHKAFLAAKELSEAVFWLRLVERTGLAATDDRLSWCIREGGELTRILRASGKTAQLNDERAAS